MRWTLLFGILAFVLLTACSNELRIDVNSLPYGSYVDCDNVKEKVCAVERNFVCGKVRLASSTETSETFIWKEFYSPCKACTARLSEGDVVGFEKGRCGMFGSDTVINSTSEITSTVQCKNASASVELIEECSKRNGHLEPLGSGCDVKFHCVVGE